MQKIRLIAVSYLNTKPLLATLWDNPQIDIHLLPPAACATALKNRQADIALIPAGALPDFESLQLCTDYCIGTRGKVDSVFLFAESPIESIDTLYLDPDSRTSNSLARILLSRYYQKSVTILKNPEYLSLIKDRSAGVVIGDKALRLRQQFSYVYDLSGLWYEFTRLPFVFALWVSFPDTLSTEQISMLNQAFQSGISQIKTMIPQLAKEENMDYQAVYNYLMHSIDYRLDTKKKESLNRYLSALCSLDQLRMPVLTYA
jgi:chorismate dehydratase